MEQRAWSWFRKISLAVSSVEFGRQRPGLKHDTNLSIGELLGISGIDGSKYCEENAGITRNGYVTATTLYVQPRTRSRNYGAETMRGDFSTRLRSVYRGLGTRSCRVEFFAAGVQLINTKSIMTIDGFKIAVLALPNTPQYRQNDQHHPPLLTNRS